MHNGVILTGPGSVWFGTVVILTRPVQWTAKLQTRLRFGLRPKWTENNKIVIVVIMCSKMMFLQRFKYTDLLHCKHMVLSYECTFCQLWFLKIKSESESEAEKSPS